MVRETVASFLVLHLLCDVSIPLFSVLILLFSL